MWIICEDQIEYIFVVGRLANQLMEEVAVGKLEQILKLQLGRVAPEVGGDWDDPIIRRSPSDYFGWEVEVAQHYDSFNGCG